MLDDEDSLEDFERRPLVQRLVVPVIGILLVAGAAAVAFTLIGNHSPAPRPHVEPHITQVQLPPPPPPPPPPKLMPPPKKEVEQTRSREPTPTKPQQVAQPKAAPAPPNRVQTSVQGNGPSSLGAGNGGGGDCIGTGCGNGNGPGGGGDQDAYYASLVKSQIMSALNHDDKLRFARYSTTCSLRFDAAGHVVSASCGSFSGDDDVRAEVNRIVRSVTAGGTSEALASKEFSVHIAERAPG